jgi:hypothetical protein
MHASTHSQWKVVPLLLALGAACATTPPPRPTEEYQPRFSYAPAAQGAKIDVTVAIVAPQFTGDGVDYLKSNREDGTVREMLRGMRAGFNGLLLAKGFNAAGPYDSLDAMTFPEKKSADFVLYPEFDVGPGYAIANKHTRAADGKSLLASLTSIGLLKAKKTEAELAVENEACTFTVQPRGTVSFVVLEPLSKEKMWVKRLELEVPQEAVEASGAVCEGQASNPEIRNAWARAHEALFNTVMGNIDRYVSAEEFKVLKRQSAELRQKKVY